MMNAKVNEMTDFVMTTWAQMSVLISLLVICGIGFSYTIPVKNWAGTILIILNMGMIAFNIVTIKKRGNDD